MGTSALIFSLQVYQCQILVNSDLEDFYGTHIWTTLSAVSMQTGL